MSSRPASPAPAAPPPSPAPATPPAAETFAPLLTESLNGFAVVCLPDERYVYVSASLCNLVSLPKDALLGCDGWGLDNEQADDPLLRARSHAVADLVLPADRAALRELLDAARSAADEGRPCESFARLRHASGSAEAWQPVELKACTDGEHVYCVMLDARVPARLESILPQFLLSTSARPHLACFRPCRLGRRLASAALRACSPASSLVVARRAARFCARRSPHRRASPRLADLVSAAPRAGHDLRTPCCSVQAATALLLAIPAVAAGA